MKPPRELPKELVSLVHHIELNKTGWWEAGLSKLIAGFLWIENKPLSCDELQGNIDSLGIRIDSDELKKVLDSMEASGSVMPFDHLYQLTQAEKSTIDLKVAKAELLERQACRIFAEILRERCPDLDSTSTWNTLIDHFLAPLISETGAATYNFIVGRDSAFPTPILDNFLSQFESSYRPSMRNAVSSFFRRPDDSVNRFILRMLNSYFFVRAGGVGEKTLRQLVGKNNERPHFRVFVDTNFLFSVIDIHDNPSNSAARALSTLRTKISTFVDLDMYLLPITVNEAKHVLIAHKHQFAGTPLPPNVASAAYDAGLSGISKRFVQRCAEAGTSLDPGDYFEPYIDSITQVSRSHGIELFNQDTTAYRTRHDVTDDINEQIRHFGTTERSKSYEQIEHDVILWHFVKDQRPPLVESPVDAGCWALTIDFSLLGFDEFKARSGTTSLPVCVHPTSFVQFLQFWIPRSEDYDRAAIETFRMPFLFQEFDKSAERATLAILRTLSRYENVEDLPEEVISRLLMNQALRDRLKNSQGIEKEVELVREALIDDRNALERELEEQRQQNLELSDLSTQRTERIRDLETLLQSLDRRNERLERQAEMRIREAEDKAKLREDELRHQAEELTERIGALEGAQKLRGARIDFVLQSIIVPALLVFITIILTTALTSRGDTLEIERIWKVALGEFLFALPLWRLVLVRRLDKTPQLNDWTPVRLLFAVHRWVFSFIGAIGIAVLGNFFWDYLKPSIYDILKALH